VLSAKQCEAGQSHGYQDAQSAQGDQYRSDRKGELSHRLISSSVEHYAAWTSAVAPSPATSTRIITNETRILVRITKFPTRAVIDKV
jgi:hypothetical protein